MSAQDIAFNGDIRKIPSGLPSYNYVICSKCPKMCTKGSDKMAYANNADPDLLLLKVQFDHWTALFVIPLKYLQSYR